MNNQSSSTGVIVGVLIVIVVLIVGFIAYKQGYFEGKDEDTSGVKIELVGGEQ